MTYLSFDSRREIVPIFTIIIVVVLVLVLAVAVAAVQGTGTSTGTWQRFVTSGRSWHFVGNGSTISKYSIFNHSLLHATASIQSYQVEEEPEKKINQFC